jgi:uncharacterized protein YdaL
VLVLLLFFLTSCLPAHPQPRASTSASGSPSATVAGSSRTLVLYDSTGTFAPLGELYGIETANLVSHFGTWTAEPVVRYTAGQAAGFDLTVYLGSTYNEALPAAFLADVAGGAHVLWMGQNIWELGRAYPGFATTTGFAATTIDSTPVNEVQYRGTGLTRNVNAGGLVKIDVKDAAKATVLAQAVRTDGQTVPWAVRGASLTYVGEVPYSYLGPDDRYLALCDLLFDELAPKTAPRHRALVRIEDVGPQSDPAQLRAITDYLSSHNIPFAVAVFTHYDDLAGVYNGGKPVHKDLSDTPKVVDELKYMAAHGGTLIMHGYTHGYAGGANPYGVSAEDFEFWRAHIDKATNGVVLDGPVPEDSTAWALSRLDAARAMWIKIGITPPDIWEFPHYAASATDYRAISPRVVARYERASYFPGLLSGGPTSTDRVANQLFPYPVKDVYGSPVIPETLGNIAVQKFNQNSVHLPSDLIASAKRQLVVRDGVASFFYHPILALQYLPQLIEGIQALGYTFVDCRSLILRSPSPSPEPLRAASPSPN